MNLKNGAGTSAGNKMPTERFFAREKFVKPKPTRTTGWRALQVGLKRCIHEKAPAGIVRTWGAGVLRPYMSRAWQGLRPRWRDRFAVVLTPGGASPAPTKARKDRGVSVRVKWRSWRCGRRGRWLRLGLRICGLRGRRRLGWCWCRRRGRSLRGFFGGRGCRLRLRMMR